MSRIEKFKRWEAVWLMWLERTQLNPNILLKEALLYIFQHLFFLQVKIEGKVTCWIFSLSVAIFIVRLWLLVNVSEITCYFFAANSITCIQAPNEFHVLSWVLLIHQNRQGIWWMRVRWSCPSRGAEGPSLLKCTRRSKATVCVCVWILLMESAGITMIPPLIQSSE